MAGDEDSGGKVITFRVPNDLAYLIDEFSSKSLLSASKICRMAIPAWIETVVTTGEILDGITLKEYTESIRLKQERQIIRELGRSHLSAALFIERAKKRILFLSSKGLTKDFIIDCANDLRREAKKFEGEKATKLLKEFDNFLIAKGLIIIDDIKKEVKEK